MPGLPGLQITAQSYAFLDIPFVKNNLRLTVEKGYVIIAYSDLCSMIVTCPRIKIDVE